jgi:restriction system protein
MAGPASSVPPYNELLWPTLWAVRELGHSARLDEINERVIERENFSDEQLAVLHDEGPRSELEYRLAWARTYLKGMGALANASRGVWETTSLGRELSEADIEPLWREYAAKHRAERAKKRRQAASESAGTDADEEAADTEDWKENLLAHMLAMSATGFERLAQRLLRAAGFINTTVTGRSGDGGIDGVGVYRLSLVSFPVFSSASAIRERLDPTRSGTSAARWPAGGIRACSLRPGRLPGKQRVRQPVMAPRRST